MKQTRAASADKVKPARRSRPRARHERVDRAASFADAVKRKDDSIARKTARVKEEMEAFAARLDLKGNTLRSARYEAAFWLGQAQSAGVKEGGTRDGVYWDNEYWRGFPEPIGARLRCMDAFVELKFFLRPGYAADAGYSDLECARMIDHVLNILRSEAPKAAPPPTRGVCYQAWLKREKIKERIEKLEDELKIPARLKLGARLFQEGYYLSEEGPQIADRTRQGAHAQTRRQGRGVKSWME